MSEERGLALWRRGAQWAEDLLFPPKCPFCRRVLEAPRSPLCPDCQEKLPWLTGKEAVRRVDFTEACISPLSYQRSVREAIHRFKFGRIRAYGGPFGTLMAQCVQDHLEEMPDGVTWAPLSKKRLRERGFDQAELLARAVGRELSLPVLSALRKTRDTRPQSELSAESARQANARGVYSPAPGANAAGRTLLLVDDVVTSGATLSECAAVLLQAGAKRVWGVTLAQAREGRPVGQEEKAK